ncbi:MAG: hypothetical protein PWP52_1733 [Bacteroidales bacterium]|nr:hypothetical protein [Bacteroidales bacterium]
MNMDRKGYNENKDFTSLEAWKKARLVKLFFYREVIPLLPVEEKYNLDIQIRKSSVSTTANISEGYGRFNFQEGIQFYRISRASMYELKDHLISCYDFKYINKEIYDKGISLIEDAKITLNGYINFVKSKLKIFKK